MELCITRNAQSSTREKYVYAGHVMESKLFRALRGRGFLLSGAGRCVRPV